MVATSPVSNQPSFSRHRSLSTLIIGARDRRAAHLQAPEGLAVPRQRLAGVVGDLHVDAERRMALLHLDVELRLAGERGIFRLHGAERAERAHLGHAPGVDHLDAVDVLEGLGHGARAGRAADHHALEIRQLAAGLLQILQQHQPHRRHRGGEAHFIGVEQFVDRGAVHLGAGHHQRRADHRRGEGERPAVGVEHRHHRHHDVARGDALGVAAAPP